MHLKINSKGQVTIPSDLRRQFGFTHNVKVKFHADNNGELYLVKAEDEEQRMCSILERMQGYCDIDLQTQEILALTRGYDL